MLSATRWAAMAGLRPAGPAVGGIAASTVTADASAGTGQAYATAYATGGTQGGTSTKASANPTATAKTSKGALAQAYANGNGGSGTAKAISVTNGTVSTGGSTLAINSITSTASSPSLPGGTTARALANNGTAYGVDASYNSEAYAGGGAKFGGLGANVGAIFNAPGTFVFGSGALGAVSSSSTSATYTNSVEWNVNTSTLPSGAGHDLDLGFFIAPLTSGTGFTSLTFALTENNVSKVQPDLHLGDGGQHLLHRRSGKSRAMEPRHDAGRAGVAVRDGGRERQRVWRELPGGRRSAGRQQRDAGGSQPAEPGAGAGDMVAVRARAAGSGLGEAAAADEPKHIASWRGCWCSP